MVEIYLPIAEVSISALLLLFLGAVAGVLAGMFGVGGGFLLTPLLIFVGIPPSVAVASQANQVIASSVSGLQLQWRRGNVDLRMGLVLLLGGLIGSTVGVFLFVGTARAAEPFTLEKDTGYRGIWYQIPGKDGVPKYSGGMATYPQQIRPLAIYAKEANKTFFVYGGRPKDKNQLLHMVSYFDHATGEVPRPRILLDKQTTDAHDNPALAIDPDGYLWIFSNTHGPQPRSSIHRSWRTNLRPRTGSGSTRSRLHSVSARSWTHRSWRNRSRPGSSRTPGSPRSGGPSRR